MKHETQALLARYTFLKLGGPTKNLLHGTQNNSWLHYGNGTPNNNRKFLQTLPEFVSGHTGLQHQPFFVFCLEYATLANVFYMMFDVSVLKDGPFILISSKPNDASLSENYASSSPLDELTKCPVMGCKYCVINDKVAQQYIKCSP